MLLPGQGLQRPRLMLWLWLWLWLWLLLLWLWLTNAVARPRATTSPTTQQTLRNKMNINYKIGEISKRYGVGERYLVLV